VFGVLSLILLRADESWRGLNPGADGAGAGGDGLRRRYHRPAWDHQRRAVYGDAVITPALSVLSAIEGIKLVTAAFDPYVVPLTVIILLMLFAVQSRGTARVAALFGPVMWCFSPSPVRRRSMRNWAIPASVRSSRVARDRVARASRELSGAGRR
jgi:hypothetical protein